MQRLLELVVVSCERPRERAAVARLEDRRLHLDEAGVIERAADRGHHARAQEEVGARVLVHQQVEIAAPVALLDVGEAVESVGQRRADLREQLVARHRKRGLTTAGLQWRACHAEDVAEIDVNWPSLLDFTQKLHTP